MNDGVAVIIPTFHRPRQLRTAIESVLAQTEKPCEILVVADGCEVKDCAECNETFHVVREFMPRVRYSQLAKRHQHCGGSPSRNWGISATQSPWIAYLDDDNTWEPTHLETLYSAATSTPETTFAISGMNIYEGGSMIHIITPSRPYHMGVDSSSVLHRRELIDEYGGWVATGHTDLDWEIVTRWLRYGEKWAVTRTPTLNYQTRDALKWLVHYAKNRVMQTVFRCEIHRAMR